MPPKGNRESDRSSKRLDTDSDPETNRTPDEPEEIILEDIRVNLKEDNINSP